MVLPAIVYLTAFILGAVHALEVDHMVAVTTLVSGRTKISSSFVLGLQWGLGHTAAVISVGALLLWLGIRIPADFDRWTEAGVGAAMVLLGAWALVRSAALHLHFPDRHGGHAHLHAHSGGKIDHDHGHHSDPSRHHRHVSTLMGAAHGLAGTAPVIALVPATQLAEWPDALVYLSFFGVGTTLAMACFAAAAAAVIDRLVSSIRVVTAIARAVALAALLLGLLWMLRALG
ncbi:MAG: hypothetical protein V3R24_09020 [Gemmatimonadales bacterium]